MYLRHELGRKNLHVMVERTLTDVGYGMNNWVIAIFNTFAVGTKDGPYLSRVLSWSFESNDALIQVC